MKRYLIFIIIFIILVVIVGIAIFYNHKTNINDNQNVSNISGEKTSATIHEEHAENRIANILQNTSNQTEISSYATTIKDQSAGRLTNISITCSTLNNTIVPNGETFSFNEVIGKPTAEKGYQEAKVIIDHKTETGIGRWKLPSK